MGTHVRPSGLMAIAVTTRAGPESTARHRWLGTSQTLRGQQEAQCVHSYSMCTRAWLTAVVPAYLTVPSELPETQVRPSGVTATQCTNSVCPLSVAAHTPSGRLHTLQGRAWKISRAQEKALQALMRCPLCASTHFTVLSLEPVTSVAPSAVCAAHIISSLCPVNRVLS